MRIETLAEKDFGIWTDVIRIENHRIGWGGARSEGDGRGDLSYFPSVWPEYDLCDILMNSEPPL